MTDFTKISSTYVRNKIQNLAFTKKTRQYISDLLTIEDFAHVKIYSSKGKEYEIASLLQLEYPEEWLSIFKEIDEEMYFYYKTLFEQRYENPLEEIIHTTKMKEFAESFATWKMMGGEIDDNIVAKIEVWRKV